MPREIPAPGQGPASPSSAAEVARRLAKQIKRNQTVEAEKATKPVKVVAGPKGHWDGARLWEEGEHFTFQQKIGEPLPDHLTAEAEYDKGEQQLVRDEMDELDEG